MSLAEGIRAIIEDAAREHGSPRVAIVVLEIGALAAVEVDALRFCLASVLRESVAAKAQIEVESPSGTGQCRDCGATVPMTTLYDPCAECGSYRVEPVHGTEMRVKALEME